MPITASHLDEDGGRNEQNTSSDQDFGHSPGVDRVDHRLARR
jgi:hypothetical protein